MKNVSKVLWGLVLVALGVIIGLNSLEITNINIFFDGWWTLFIIVPSFIGLFEKNDRFVSFICLMIGCVLLASSQGLLDYEIVLKLIFPVILVIIGLSILWSTIRGKKKDHTIKKNIGETKYISAFLKEEVSIIDGKVDIATVDSVFGHAIMDLRKSDIEREATIKLSAIFGSVDVIVPKDVTVILTPYKFLGSIENFVTTKSEKDSKILYIEASSIFGRISIK